MLVRGGVHKEADGLDCDWTVTFTLWKWGFSDGQRSHILCARGESSGQRPFFVQMT